MEKNNIVYDEEDLEFLDFLRSIVEHNMEMFFTLKGLTYRIEAPGGKPFAYLDERDTPEYYFEDLDDLLEHYIIDGVPFKEILHEIDSYGAD